jgi:formate-dependent nitrite reductase membrane component NrfD
VTAGNTRYDQPRNQILLPGLRARRSQTPGMSSTTPATYYGRPMIKAPHWKWFVPGYFFIAGIAAGVAFFGALARFFGGPRHRVTVRHARYLALALSLICPVLLILDLGRPRRFFNMLRVVKVRSPLSLGTWILMAFGVTSGLLAARQMALDGVILRRRSLLSRLALLLPDRLLTLLQGALGLGLGGYTGVLLAATAVPLWAAAGILLGPLFLAASITSGAAALILLGLLSGRQSRAARADLEIVASVGAITQLGLAAAHEAFVPERISQPLRHGVWGRVFRYGVLGGGLIAPMGLRLLAWRSGARMERIFSALSAIFTLFGTLAERFALVEAGKVSARDPLAYQELTAGAPGEARPTPAEQGRRAANAQPYRPGVSARDTAPQTSPSAKPVE